MNYSLLVTCEVTWRYLRTNKHRMVHAFSYTNQKMKKLILSMALAAFALLGKAYDFEANGFYYNITSLSDLTVALTGNEGASYSGDVVVPEEITWNSRTFVVNEILERAFHNCTLTSLVIPPSIQYMHLGNATITKLIVEDSAEELHASGYQDYQMQDAYGMADGTIEELYLGRNTPSRFQNTYLKTVAFGDKVTYIAGYMFYGCNITGTLVLPDNIKEIGSNAFDGNGNLEKVVANGLETVGFASFDGCSKLTGVDMCSLKEIGPGAFLGCTSLSHFDIPQGVATIGGQAFAGCTGLVSVTIPNSIMDFGEAGYYSTNHNVFSGCASLNSITVSASKPFDLEETNFDAQTYINAILHVPSSSLDTYKNADVWKNFFNISGDVDVEDNVCSVVIIGCNDDSYGGFVEIGDLQIKDNEYIISANQGDKVTMKFIPNSNENESYELGKVTIDEKDVTSNVVNNELIVEVTGNMTIDIDWDYVEPNPILLTIKQAENGCTKMVVNKWETYKFFIEPSEGWTLHSVELNGEDITNRIGDDGALKLSEISENTTLFITFESNASSVKAIDSSRAKVYGADNSIVISGANEGENIQIYDDAGLLIETEKATSNSMRIPLANGIYIVKLDGKTVKVAI